MTARLYAKRPPECAPPTGLRNSVFLQGHLEDAYRAASEVINVSGDDQLRALGLESRGWQARLRRIVVAAAALHDLGKANDHFQGMLSGARTAAQGLRHEWVAYHLFQQPGWQDWLAAITLSPLDAACVLWCISGHHPGYGRPCPPEPIDGAGNELVFLSRHPDFRVAIDWIDSTFELTRFAPAAPEGIALERLQPGNAFQAIRKAIAVDSMAWGCLPDDEKRLVAACKASLIAADVAASALARGEHAPALREAWITDALACRPATDDIEALVRERLNGAPERPFQTAAATSRSRVTLVRAGCGTGKTIAAYLWAARRCPGHRVYVCYPTTGTATEGFRGYLFDEDAHRSKHGARLFHSRADVDLELILDAREDEDESQLRIEALLAWSTPIAVCTADTVLGIVQNQRRGLFAWPALAQSAFVFDEIHAYDGQLFGCLLRFIEALRGVPILLMTASLTAAQRAALEETLSRTGESLAEIGGPIELEHLPRYVRQDPDPFERAQREFTAGGKVLWVCNTVDRAIHVADRMGRQRPIIYHSRFRYVDRVGQHQRLMAAFEGDGPALAICTQVAEMSLDISATLLVTELAPVPALIQRLGRLNRRARPPAPGQEPVPPMPFVVLEPLGADGALQTNPYSTKPEDYGDWPAQARQWLDRLGGAALSQADLATAWTQSAPDDVPTPAVSTWLDGGPITQVGAVRDASPGVTVVLEQDADDVESGTVELAKVALPMPPPRGRVWREWRRVRGVPVVPTSAIHYDVERGGRWRA